MTYESRKKKISSFSTDDTITDSSTFDFVKDGINKKTSWGNILDKFSEVYGLGARLFEVEADLIASDIQLDEYAIVEGNNYGLYKITSLAAGGQDVTLTSGFVATLQSTLDVPIPADYTELRAITTAGLFDGTPITVTDSGIAGSGVLRNVASHGLSDNGGTIIVINSNWYWDRRYVGRSLPEWWEAAGDGTNDDLSSLASFLSNAPRPLALSPGKVYAISALLEHTLTEDLSIDFNGSTIKLISSTDIEDAVKFTPNGYNIEIKNAFIDANQKSHRALHIRNESNTTIKDCILTDVRCENAYRSSTSFQGGDGIHIRGGFDRVVITRPVVKNINMAVGAGVSGSEGVFGITVTRNFAGTLDAKYVKIIEPYIENVSSDDDSYYFDQDGIRFLANEPTSTNMGEGASLVLGGTIKNCWGRGIKVQRNDCTVVGTSFYRDSGFDTGYGNTEIDFQYGSGQVSNIQCNYTNFNPTTIVNFTSGDRKGSGSVVNGINCSLDGTTLDCAVQRFRGASSVGSPLYASNISIEGSTVHMIRYDTNLSTSADPKQYCVAENCHADDITTAFLRIRGSGGNVNKVVINNCGDKSGNGVLLQEGISGNSAFADLSARDNQGLAGGNSQGQWTASIQFGGASTGITYASRTGEYVKNGLWVTCTLYVVLTNKGSSTGNATITGLPFDVDPSTRAYSAANFGDLRNVTYTGYAQAWAEINTNIINLGFTSEAGTYSSMTDANFSNTSEFILTITYKTDSK